MSRAVEIFVALNALGGILVFLGLRHVGEKAKDAITDGTKAILRHDDESKENEKPI